MIIVLESNERFAELARRSLAQVRPEMPVVICKTEEETVARVQRRWAEVNEPTIVLLDLLEGQSLEILSKLKIDHASWRTVIVVLGRVKTIEEINECYRLGCNAYIARPDSEADFSTAVDTLRLFIEAIRMPGRTAAPMALAAANGSGSEPRVASNPAH